MRLADSPASFGSGTRYRIVDNLSRRSIDNELETSSLTPIRPIGERIGTWQNLTGNTLNFHNFDVAMNYHRLLTLIRESQPDAVIHFAEQRRRSVFDEIVFSQTLHGQQQFERHQ